MKKLLIGFLIGLVAGGCVVGTYLHHVKERDLASMVFERELYVAREAVVMLRLVGEQRFDTVEKLQRKRLDGAVDESYRLMVSYEPKLGWTAPRLALGLAEVEDYLKTQGSEGRTRVWLQDVSAFVKAAARSYEQGAI